MRRLASVDALRGLCVAAMLLVNNPGDWGAIYAPLRHADWVGCTPTDLVFPFFLFIVGVSLALGLKPGGERALAWRALRVFGLGLLLHALAWGWLGQAHFRPLGVLQRIALCLLPVGLLAMRSSARTQWVVLFALLLGYAALLGDTTPARNLAGRIDGILLGPLAWRYDPVSVQALEPEGLLSTLGAWASCLFGLRAGFWLREGRLQALLALGLGACALGWLWSLQLPWIKALWTPSYALWTGGLATLALWAAHQAIDRRGTPDWGRALGRNAIAAYAGAWVLSVGLDALGWKAVIVTRGLGWLEGSAQSLAFAVGFVGLFWCLAIGLDRRRIYWRL